jgi:hypothetical protein
VVSSGVTNGRCCHFRVRFNLLSWCTIAPLGDNGDTRGQPVSWSCKPWVLGLRPWLGRSCGAGVGWGGPAARRSKPAPTSTIPRRHTALPSYRRRAIARRNAHMLRPAAAVIVVDRNLFGKPIIVIVLCEYLHALRVPQTSARQYAALARRRQGQPLATAGGPPQALRGPIRSGCGRCRGSCRWRPARALLRPYREELGLPLPLDAPPCPEPRQLEQRA